MRRQPSGASVCLAALGCAAGSCQSVDDQNAQAAPVTEERLSEFDQAFNPSSVELRLVRVYGPTPLREAQSQSDQSSFLLAVNAGFFDAEVRPIGLAASGESQLTAFDASLGGGIVWTANGVAHLTAAEDWREPIRGLRTFDLALQSRPRLIVNSRNNIRRDDDIKAARTAVCLRKGGRELVFVRRAAESGFGGPSLHALAAELLTMGCEEALNLDGGPSAGWGSVDGTWAEPRTPIAMVLVVEKN